MVGASGTMSRRFWVVTAMSFNLPDFTLGSTAIMADIIMGTCPATTSATAGPVPL